MRQPNDWGDEESLTPAERELAGALGALRPARTEIDRDRLMFDAGYAAGAAAERAATRRRVWAWRGAAAAMLAVSASLGVILAMREGGPALVADQGGPGLPAVPADRREGAPTPPEPGPLVIRATATTPPPPPPPSAGRRDAQAFQASDRPYLIDATVAPYLAARDAVLRRGLDALATPRHFDPDAAARRPLPVGGFPSAPDAAWPRGAPL